MQSVSSTTEHQPILKEIVHAEEAVEFVKLLQGEYRKVVADHDEQSSKIAAYRIQQEEYVAQIKDLKDELDFAKEKGE